MGLKIFMKFMRNDSILLFICHPQMMMMIVNLIKMIHLLNLIYFVYTKILFK